MKCSLNVFLVIFERGICGPCSIHTTVGFKVTLVYMLVLAINCKNCEMYLVTSMLKNGQLQVVYNSRPSETPYVYSSIRKVAVHFVHFE